MFERYDPSRQALGTAQIDLLTDTVVAITVGGSYVFNAAHETTADLTGVLDSHTLTGKSLDTEGRFRSAPITAVITGSDVGRGLVFAVDGSHLLGFVSEWDSGQPFELTAGTWTVRPSGDGWMVV
jgi:hypothetical protein